MAAQVDERSGRLGVLDPLRHQLETERLGQPDDRLHDCPVLRVLVQIHDETPVDFERPDGERLEVTQRTEARTEVVDRHLDVQLVQTVEGLPEFG